MFIVTYFIAVFFKKFWFQLPEDGELIAPKHLRVMTLITYRIVHLLVLRVLFTYGMNNVKGIFCNV